jgi:riboflavin kinase/FMN adenylyltransferase
MTHIQHLSNAQLQRPSIVTIGVFDGVHRGHQHLISQLVQAAKQTDRAAVVLTFFPHPDVILRNLQGRYYLTPPEQKAQILLELGVDCVITHPFDDSLRQVRAAQFMDDLVATLHMRSLWVGADFALGYQREGTVPFLRHLGLERGYDVQEIDLMLDGTRGKISSSEIREAIQAGHMEAVKQWLGRPYSVVGKVIHGQMRGRQLGYPTANTEVWDEQVLPANGIYAGWAHLGSERFMAMTNVGMRPTFDGQNITVEPYLLDFDRDIYGQTLEVSFETRLRPEARFSNLDELIVQIGRDVEQGRAYLEALNPRPT